jgi:hypothetical protein
LTDEEYSNAAASELEGTVEVHYPMLWLIGWSCHLIVSPLCHESLQFHYPFGDASNGVPIVEYVRVTP